VPRSVDIYFITIAIITELDEIEAHSYVCTASPVWLCLRNG